MASARPWMPYAHEPVNPARHARTCAWLRAASRLLSQGFDSLFATGLFWLCQKGQERPFLAFSTRNRNAHSVACGVMTQAFHLAESKVS
jgi:hypothetical protein